MTQHDTWVGNIPFLAYTVIPTGSLAEDNTCMHNLVPCVHTHTYIDMYGHQQWSAPLLFLIRNVWAKRVECLQTLGLLPA